MSTTSIGRFIDSAANALDGNGEKLRADPGPAVRRGRASSPTAAATSSTSSRTCRPSSRALRDSNDQIVQFQDRLATLTSVLDDSRSDLDAALTNLSVAVGEVQRFVAGTRNQTAEQLQRLGATSPRISSTTRSISRTSCTSRPTRSPTPTTSTTPTPASGDRRVRARELLQPDAVHLRQRSAPSRTPPRPRRRSCARSTSARRCGCSNFNYLPFPINPYLSQSPSPDELIYTDPELAPGGAGRAPAPPETPPSVSAYTGLDGDVPPPPVAWAPTRRGRRLPLSSELRAPSPALYPGAPVPAGHHRSDLPAGTAGPAGHAAPGTRRHRRRTRSGTPLPAEGTPPS